MLSSVPEPINEVKDSNISDDSPSTFERDLPLDPSSNSRLFDAAGLARRASYEIFFVRTSSPENAFHWSTNWLAAVSVWASRELKTDLYLCVHHGAREGDLPVDVEKVCFHDRLREFCSDTRVDIEIDGSRTRLEHCRTLWSILRHSVEHNHDSTDATENKCTQNQGKTEDWMTASGMSMTTWVGGLRSFGHHWELLVSRFDGRWSVQFLVFIVVGFGKKQSRFFFDALWVHFHTRYKSMTTIDLFVLFSFDVAQTHDGVDDLDEEIRSRVDRKQIFAS